MSAPTYTLPPRGEAGQFDYSLYDDAHGQGLVTFAGVMLMIAGVLNALHGIAAIDSANVFVRDARYVFGDLNTWGWFVLALGVLQVLWMPSYPILAMVILPLDILAIWGLLVYGGRRRAFRGAQGGTAA